jgi:hypothetical protein
MGWDADNRMPYTELQPIFKIRNKIELAHHNLIV